MAKESLLQETATQFSHASDYDGGVQGEETIRDPLPLITDTLYDYSYSDDEEEEEEEEDMTEVWSIENQNTNHELVTLYRTPLELMFQGSFQEAKVTATAQDRWLLVNLQSPKEFNSHVMNRDLWSNETVAQTIRSHFLFWQEQNHTEEGMKVCTFYKLKSFPVILVIDPITGQNMRSSVGLIEPYFLLVDLLPPYMENGPEYHLNKPFSRKLGLEKSSKAIKEEKKKEMYPPLPDEPKCDSSLVCRVGVRLPNGKRFKRSFLLQDSIQLLWSFCCSEIEEVKARPFKLMLAIPGASKCLDYDSESTFKESGISNSMILLIWE